MTIDVCFLFFSVSSGREHELLLEAPNSLVSLLEDIRNALVEPSNKSVHRTSVHEFVCQYKNPEYYLPRCFPTIFPYGRGCPSDENCHFITMANYIKHMLCLGGGPDPRRFQKNAKLIFCMYSMEMRRKIGGVAYLAQRKEYDEQCIDASPNIKDINELLSYLDVSNTGGDVRNGNDVLHENLNVEPSSNGESTNRVTEMEKLIKRLIPYSKSLQGSTSQIAYERGKLMAMIPSPIICNYGSWRLFFTTAPADLYESRFFDVVASPITNSSIDSWALREEKVCVFCSSTTCFVFNFTFFNYVRPVILRLLID